MLILLIAVSIVLLIGGIIFATIGQRKKTRYYDYPVPFVVGITVAVISAIVLAICIITLIFFIAQVDTAHILDEKITMYEEENAIIEENIMFTVNNYMDHEKEVFTSLTPENAANALVLFPELHSDTVVMSQINTYLANRENIKTLKEAKINIAKTQWWINFGN